MQLYLSSYQVGNSSDELLAMFREGKKIAVIGNAMDGVSVEERREHIENTFTTLREIGLMPEEVDLRDYFDNSVGLAKQLNQFAGVWVRGGNTFILRRAMQYSGMDSYVGSKVKDKNFVYGGYSAGVCLLGSTLHGLELVDDPNMVPAGYQKEIIWDGLSILDYTIVPHYKSDHPESAMVDKSVEYLIRNNIPYKTLRDGEVIVGETD